MNVLLLILAVHDAAVPNPSTWPSSCSATEKKSYCDVDRPPVVAPKNQLADALKAIEPIAGAKSVLGVADAPGSPRPRTVASQSLVPLALQPPGPPRPNCDELPNDRAPT